MPEVGRREAVAGKIDEQDPVAGQAAGERCHPDAGGGDAVDEEHRVAGTRFEDTHPHGRRLDVDPTFLHVEPVRCREAPPSPATSTPPPPPRTLRRAWQLPLPGHANHDRTTSGPRPQRRKGKNHAISARPSMARW